MKPRNPFAFKGKAEREPVRFAKLDLVTFTISLTRRIWIIQHDQGAGGHDLFYDMRALSFSARLDCATFFGSDAEAQETVNKLEVSLSRHAKIVNLYEYLAKRLGADPVETGEAAEGWDDMGLIDPKGV